MDSKLLTKIDEISLKADDPILNLATRQKQDKMGAFFFNDLNLKDKVFTTNRHLVIGGDLSRYFQVGFNETKEICFVGVSQFFLDIMGFTHIGVAWANKERKTFAVYINFALKRQQTGDFVLTNQKFALPVFQENLKNAVMNAKMLVLVATHYDGQFSHADKYSKPIEFRDINDSHNPQKPSGQFKQTNF